MRSGSRTCYTLWVNGSTPRILIISASIGGGHNAAARALEAACLEKGLSVLVIDLLDYTTVPFRHFYRQAYFDLVRTAPDFVDWLGKRLDRRPSEHKSRQAKLRSRLTRLISYHLPRLISRYQPDIVIHTHFLAAEILSSKLAPDLWQRRNKRRNILQAMVITDFYTHDFWMQPVIKHYYVAAEELAVHLQASGIDAERITVSGIPIDLSFSQLESKETARRKLNYTVDRDVILFMAGGMTGKTLRILLKQLRELRWPVSATVICGRSPELVEIASEEAEAAEGPVSFDILGFSHTIATYMAAADILLGKPGGLTSSEALAAGLPFAIVQPYPLQEEANTSYLLEYGAGLRIDPLSVLNYKLRRFFGSEELRHRMQLAAGRLGKPQAARLIVSSLLDKIDRDTSEAAMGGKTAL